MGISPLHTLVLVNNGKGTTRELLAFAEIIKEKVKNEYNILLEIEPTIVRS